MPKDLGPVFPLLKPSTWPGRDSCTVQPLVRNLRVPGLPLVAFAYPSSPFRAFVGPARLEAIGQSEEEVAREALYNLSRSQPVCSLTEVNRPSGGTLEAASGPDDPYAVERILHAAFMAHLQHKVFQAKMLAVGIPGRPFLFAAPIERALDGSLLEVVRFVHSSMPADSDDRLSPDVFVLNEGTICGRVVEENGVATVDLVV